MKKKGFTLVELLAVIAVLAIIALITIPIVIKTMNNSEEQSEKESISGYARAVEDDIANYMMLHPGSKYENYIQTEGFEYKGNRVFCESKEVSSTGKLTLKNCYVSDKELNAEEKSKKRFYNYINGKVEKIDSANINPSDDSETPKIYSIGDRITVAGEQYYVIEDSGEQQDYVVAIKANPLTVDEINSLGYDVKYNFAEREGTSIAWAGVDYGKTSNYNQSYIKNIVDTWLTRKFTNNELKAVNLNGTNYQARIPTREELQPIGWPNCQGMSDCWPSENIVEWLSKVDYWYWTMSPVSSDVVWIIDYGISTNYMYEDVDWFIYVEDNANDIGGTVRPVINVYKSKIQN